MNLLLINIAFVAALTANAYWLAVNVFNFWRTQVMMACYYTLSPHVDQNQRCASQAEYMSNYVHLSVKSSKYIGFSLITFGAIIIARLVAGVL